MLREDRLDIGVISDTHGLIRPEALQALEGSALILHAGDVGAEDVLKALGRIAPVTAVRGNVDRGSWAEALPARQAVRIAGFSLYVLHNLSELDFDPAAEGFAAVISGHSHRPRIAQKNGVLYFNPGSAGPRRFTLPVAVGRLQQVNGALQATILELGA